MIKLIRILLLPLFALTTIYNSYAYNPDDNRDSVVMFKFITNKESFWSSYKDNEQQFDKLANFIHQHREKIMRGKMPIYVNGYCSSLPNPEDNKNIGRIRSNHVKSYIILNYGFREEMFKTRNHHGTYQGLNNIVTVAFVFKQSESEPSTIQPKATIVDSIIINLPEPEITPTTTTIPAFVEQSTPTENASINTIEINPTEITRKYRVKKPKTKSYSVVPITDIAPQSKTKHHKTTKKEKTKRSEKSKTSITPIINTTPASQPVSKPAVKTTRERNKPASQPVSKPADKVTRERNKPTSQPVSKPAVKTTRERNKPASQPVSKPAVKTTRERNKPASQPVSKPAVKTTRERNKPVKIDTYFFNKKTFNVELKTNLLALAATAPNLEVEFIFANRVSLNIEGQWAHSNWNDNTRHFRLWNCSPEIRVYPFKKTAVFFGVYYHMGEYNFKFNQTGYQGKYKGAGLSIGYKLPVTRSVGFEFSLGAGYLNTNVNNYYIEDDCNRFISKYPERYIAPTKAKISFIWRIGGAK